MEESLATKTLGIVTGILLRGTGTLGELREKAGQILLQLSASNFDLVFSRIAPGLGAGDELTSPLVLIEYLNFNAAHLSELLIRAGAAVEEPAFKKSSHQLLLARVLTKAIWNWIDHYPMEFVSLCQNGTRLNGKSASLLLLVC